MPLFNAIQMAATDEVTSYDMGPRSSIGIRRGRFVEWPEGAPLQEDVPQAGERVYIRSNDGLGLWNYVSGAPKVYTVSMGIPYVRNAEKDYKMPWRLRVDQEHPTDKTEYPFVHKLVRVSDHEKEERRKEAEARTYTADEIMDAVNAINPELGEKIVNYMNVHESRS